jgi:hypothetical protein
MHMKSKNKYNTVIIELRQRCPYSMVSTFLNIKLSAQPIYSKPIQLQTVIKQLKTLFPNEIIKKINQTLPQQLFGEFYNGFRMNSRFYFNFEELIKSFNSMSSHYSEEPEFKLILLSLVKSSKIQEKHTPNAY